MKNKGFTLIELIAVIVIIGVLSLIVTGSVFAIINASKENTTKTILKNLEDAAITYGMKDLFISDKCAIDKVVDESNYASITMSSECRKMITVNELINSGYFTDNKNNCDKNKEIFIYKYHYTTHDNITNQDKDYYDLKAYVPTNTCKN